MNILSIGNSFSEDAQRYLHEVAVADGFDLDTYNIVLGGCSLSMHYENMTGKANPYCFHKNSKGIKNEATLDDALLSGNYDVITIQQVSHLANKYDTYQPYLNEVIAYVRKCAPNAKSALHQTWAYEQDSDRLKLVAKYENHTDMFNDIKLAYDKAAKEINADFIIPSGELFQNLLKSGIEKVHRDTFHSTFGLARYSLALLWYKALTGRDISGIDFHEFDEEVTDAEIEIAKKCVNETLEQYK